MLSSDLIASRAGVEDITLGTDHMLRLLVSHHRRPHHLSIVDLGTTSSSSLPVLVPLLCLPFNLLLVVDINHLTLTTTSTTRVRGLDRSRSRGADPHSGPSSSRGLPCTPPRCPHDDETEDHRYQDDETKDDKDSMKRYGGALIGLHDAPPLTSRD